MFGHLHDDISELNGKWQNDCGCLSSCPYHLQNPSEYRYAKWQGNLFLGFETWPILRHSSDPRCTSIFYGLQCCDQLGDSSVDLAQLTVSQCLTNPPSLKFSSGTASLHSKVAMLGDVPIFTCSVLSSANMQKSFGRVSQPNQNQLPKALFDSVIMVLAF